MICWLRSLIALLVANREVMAISGWRRLVFYSDFTQTVVAEGKYSNLKADGDKLIQALKDQGLQDPAINDSTQKRYLALGKRVQMHKATLMRWEMFHQRECLIDVLSILRLIFAISEREEDIAYILKELFLQQRAGIRSSLVIPRSKNEVRTPQNIGRGMLIKRMVLNHFFEVCPNLATTLQPFVDNTHYEFQYGVLVGGERTKEINVVMGDDDARSGLLSFPSTFNIVFGIRVLTELQTFRMLI